jgi:hypothetical protein
MTAMTMTKYLIAALVTILSLSSCAAPNNCKTRCGLTYVNNISKYPAGYESYPKLSCEEFQKAETEILEAFDTYVKDPRFKKGWGLYMSNPFSKNSCSALQGWNVTFQNIDNWIEKDVNGIDGPVAVYGTAWCDPKQIFVNNKPWRMGSLTHELAHAIQECNGRNFKEKKDPGHSDWFADDIYTTINILRGRGDLVWSNCGLTSHSCK